MTAKTIKPKAGERAMKRLLKQVDAGSARREQLQRQFEEYKTKSLDIVTECQAQINRQNKALSSNSMTITELESQVANQHKENAELRQDLQRARKLCDDANIRSGMCRNTLDDQRKIIERLETELTAALIPAPLSLMDRVFGKW